MKHVVQIAVVVGLLSAGRLQAQTTPVNVSVATTGMAPLPCELHVFPAADLSYSGPTYPGLAGLGTLAANVGASLDAASSQYQGSGSAQMKSFLAPAVQVNLLIEAGILGFLKLPADTIIVVERAIPDRDDGKNSTDELEYLKSFDQNLNHGRPIINTDAKCYREFIIKSVGIWSHSITSYFIYRKFDEQHWQNGSIISTDYLTSAPKHFPAKSPDKMEEASLSLRSAFAGNFTEWALKKLKP